MTEQMHIVHMAMMGLLIAVIAPVLLLVLGRIAPRLDRATVPATVALPGFVTLHAGITVYTELNPVPPLLDAAMHLGLLIGATLFWAPVLGVRRRLPDAGRMLYLFIAIPLLDLAGVWVVAIGDNAGGLSMITGMLPMGVAAVAITWNWISREERRAVLAESGVGEW
jgi:cytochrome c oxidase assembly factor CtaG